MIFAKALQVVRARDKESEVKDQWFGMVASTTGAYGRQHTLYYGHPVRGGGLDPPSRL